MRAATGPVEPKNPHRGEAQPRPMQGEDAPVQKEDHEYVSQTSSE